MTVAQITASGAVAAAYAADASLVFAVQQVLTDRHISIPDPIRLLTAALDGVRQALARAGIAERLPDLTATDPAAARDQFQERFDRAVDLAQGRVSEADLQYAAARAMTVSLDDSHTAFMTPEQWTNYLQSLRGEASFTGIGVRTTERNGRFYFLEVLPGGPAEAAGARQFDRVVAVDGAPTEGITLLQLSTRLRGPAGTAVAVTVRRPGEAAPLTITITRAPITTPAVSHRMLDGSVGYLRFRSFSTASAQQVQAALEALQAQGARAIVLDIRGNPGGLIVELVRVASALLPPGLRIAVREDRQAQAVVDVTSGGPVLNPATPLAVIVDGGTGSSGEILAAAVQEHRRGTLVGQRTAGAVLNSLGFSLPGGAGLSVAVRRISTGNGVVLERVGVRPDVEVAISADDLEAGVDAQLQRAIDATMQRAASVRPAPGPVVAPAWLPAAHRRDRVLEAAVTG
jgi:carboxyl-terminal processing protease